MTKIGINEINKNTFKFVIKYILDFLDLYYCLIKINKIKSKKLGLVSNQDLLLLLICLELYAPLSEVPCWKNDFCSDDIKRLWSFCFRECNGHHSVFTRSKNEIVVSIYIEVEYCLCFQLGWMHLLD